MNYMNAYEELRRKKGVIDCSLSYNSDDEVCKIISDISECEIYEGINRYPDLAYTNFINALKDKFPNKNFILGSGSEDLIWKINTFLLKNKRTGVVVPNFYRIYETIGSPEYIRCPIEKKGAILDVKIIEEAIRKGNYDAVWLSNPNPITGQCFHKDDLYKMISTFPEIMFIVDEVSIDAVIENQYYSLLTQDMFLDNLIVIRSFSKFYSIPGARVGYACISERYGKVIQKNSSIYPVSSGSLLYAQKLLSDVELGNRMKIGIQNNKEILKNMIQKEGLISFIDSLSNVMVLYSPQAKFELWNKFLEVGLITCSVEHEPGIEINNSIRITIPSNKKKFEVMLNKIVELLRCIRGGSY